MDQIVTAPAEVERMEEEERMEVEETEAERAEGVPVRRRLFTPELQGVADHVQEVAQPLDEIVERPEFRRRRSDRVPVEARRTVQDQIVPMELEDDEIFEMPPVEDVLSPRRRRRRLRILDEQIVIEDYARRAERLNRRVVVERISVSLEIILFGSCM